MPIHAPRTIPLTLLLLLATAIHFVRAEDAPPEEFVVPPGHTTHLFEHGNLDRFRNDGCEWEYDDETGVITILKGGLETLHAYGDFTLEFETRCEAQAGRIVFPANYAGEETPVDLNFICPQGEGWMKWQVSVIGNKLIYHDPGNNSLDFDIDRSFDKPIRIEYWGKVSIKEPLQLRNVTLTEHGYTPMFNGQDLTGWEQAGKSADQEGWIVENGEVICTGIKHGPWLRSEKEYDDFNLRLEYQVSEGGNSGIFVRVPADGNHHRDTADLPEAGFEVQVLDDHAARYRDLKDYQYTGSVYDIAGATQHVSRGPGVWNTLELDCNGHHITSRHNGVVIVDALPADFPLLTLRKLKGYLGLQNHSTVVKFRNLRIGPPLYERAEK